MRVMEIYIFSIINFQLSRTHSNRLKCAFFISLQIVNLSSHAMPPMRMLSKDFIGSFLATDKQIQTKTIKEKPKIIDSMEISDDEAENSPENMKILRLKAIENEEKSIREISAKKKELDVVIQRKFKSLKLNSVEHFEM